MKKLDSKSIIAINMLQGAKMPCVWASKDYFWRDFGEAKFLNDDYLCLVAEVDVHSRYYNRYFVFSIKENLLVDGFHENAILADIFHDIKQFEKDPRGYGK